MIVTTSRPRCKPDWPLGVAAIPEPLPPLLVQAASRPRTRLTWFPPRPGARSSTPPRRRRRAGTSERDWLLRVLGVADAARVDATIRAMADLPWTLRPGYNRSRPPHQPSLENPP